MLGRRQPGASSLCTLRPRLRSELWFPHLENREIRPGDLLVPFWPGHAVLRGRGAEVTACASG